MAEMGRLKINVYQSGRGNPLAFTGVQVISKAGDVVAEAETDTSGQTDILNLSAPPQEYSLAEDMPQPYSEYTVNVLHDKAVTASVAGVQIFPNTTAEQDIIIAPQRAAPENIVIPPPVLYGQYPPKIPEDDVKPLPRSKGFVVLPDPIVPEFVIVHAGNPDDKSAQNYWVPFKDYIKNVASCEIYSTWPDSAIRANVLAILSFTLNRIYTEWYRGKGYDFTITNSTAFDHAFSYGRNYFNEISAVVDELFTTFVTKEGIRQPMLTQYCDGKNVTCPGWMTQWGTKNLADKGYSAIDILKNAYGQEVFLMQAKKVDGVPKSFQGTLQNGSRGPNVRTIQEQLNRISNNYPAIKKVKADGIYGPATLSAVEAFQRIFNLPASGIVDFGTWYRISDIYVAVSRIAELK